MPDSGSRHTPTTHGSSQGEFGVEDEDLHEAAAPDVPPAIGYAVIGAFGFAVISFMIFFSGSAQSRFVTTVTFCFLVVYFAVPVIFFLIQPKATRKTTWSRFSLRGLDIRTGHLGGREALFQILALPVCLMMAAVAMGVIWMLDH